MNIFLFRHFRRLGVRLPLWAALSLAILLGLSVTLKAAPIKFRFEATVLPLPPGNGDVQLPFTLEEGSVIDGRFTFDPDIPAEPTVGTARTYLQPHSFELSFAGFSFGAEQYQATVNNDSGINDGPNAGPADFITVRCSTGQAVDCSTEPLEFPGTGPLAFSITMRFAGDVSLLSEPTLPEDVETWNGFTIIRELDLIFSTNAVNVEGFNTTLSSFVVVPEPSTSYLLLSCLWLLLPKNRLNHKQS